MLHCALAEMARVIDMSKGLGKALSTISAARPFHTFCTGVEIPGVGGAHTQVPRAQPAGLQGGDGLRSQLHASVARHAYQRESREDRLPRHQLATIQIADGRAGAAARGCVVWPPAWTKVAVGTTVE